MHILILNWRDIKNPHSGGAEILTHEMAKRWAAWGHSVTMFTSRFSQGKHEEEIDGVHIIRRGTWWTVHIYAFFYYLVYGNSYGVVVDEVHWFPFFSALYARKKTVLLACEVARDLYPLFYPFPLSFFWRAIEKLYFFFYRTVPTLAISKSTKEDLVAEGLDAGHITVLPMGISVPAYLPSVAKEASPTLIYLGRITKQKGVEDALEAFFRVKETIPGTNLWIAGSGDSDYIGCMKENIKRHKFSQSVRWFGLVSDGQKFTLLAKAHLLLFPSVHEGWGLVASEAAFVGTPTIAYNVSGVRDVVVNGKTGILVDGGPQELARAVTEVINDQKLFQQLRAGALAEAKRRSWNNTAKEALRVLRTV